MLDVLRGEGLENLEFMVVGQMETTWEKRASGFDEIDFPVMADSEGVVFDLFSADAFNVFLIDKQGRLVSQIVSMNEELVDQLNKRIRQLHAE